MESRATIPNLEYALLCGSHFGIRSSPKVRYTLQCADGIPSKRPARKCAAWCSMGKGTKVDSLRSTLRKLRCSVPRGQSTETVAIKPKWLCQRNNRKCGA